MVIKEKKFKKEDKLYNKKINSQQINQQKQIGLNKINAIKENEFIKILLNAKKIYLLFNLSEKERE